MAWIQILWAGTNFPSHSIKFLKDGQIYLRVLTWNLIMPLKYHDYCEIWVLKCNLFNFDMLITFWFGVSSNLSQQKSPTTEILLIYFLRTIFRRKHLFKIYAVGLFSFDKFEETPKQKVICMSKLNSFTLVHFFLLIHAFALLWRRRCWCILRILNIW